MNRRQIFKRAAKTKVMSNKESSESDCSSDEESGNASLGLLEMFLSLQKTPKRKKQKKRVSKTCKGKRSNCNDMTNYALTGFHLNGSKCCTNCKKRNNCKQSKKSISTINLESDEEKAHENIGDSHLKSIENKVDNFFKSANLASDDEEIVVPQQSHQKDEGNLISKKPKDFYMIISDSEDETTEKPCTSDDIIPGISDFHNISRGNTSVEKNKDELMDLVDSILQPNDDQFQKVSKPDDNWEDYKKKTEEMLGSVTGLIHSLKGNNKMEEPVPKEKPSLKEVTPSCPVCLETLGVSEGARESTATFCGHVFCKTCITRVAKTTKKCPTCRKNVNLKKIHPVYF